MFKNPFSFSGRIRRLEYGLSLLIYIFGIFAIMGILVGLSLLSTIFVVLYPLLILVAMWFSYAQAVKRSHDVGYSGWYILIPFYTIYLLFADSQPGANRYGPNPKNIGDNAPEIDQIGTENP